MDALEKESTTWGEVVKRAVNELSAKPSEQKGKSVKVTPDEGSVKQLIEEAEELKNLLERLGEKMGDGPVEAVMLSAAS